MNVTAQISETCLQHNAKVISEYHGPEVEFCAVVKANGYGHDARLVVAALVKQHADSFAVFTIEEAEEICHLTEDKRILTMEPLYAGMDVQLLELARARGMHCTIASAEGLSYVQSILGDSPYKLSVHLKVDTGMGRSGPCPPLAAQLLNAIKDSDTLELAGVYTHFAASNDEDMTFSREQLLVFQEFLNLTGLDKDRSVIKHACNTTAAIRLPEAGFDMIRVGIGLYGYSCYDFGGEVDLRPALKLTAPLVEIKTLTAGKTCGYGRTFTAKHDMTIGIVPMGYADGVTRGLSNRGAFLADDGTQVPIIGRVSMDRTIVDITGVTDVHEGMPLTIIDNHPGSCCDAKSLANNVDTISYEILTSIGKRVKRVAVDRSECRNRELVACMPSRHKPRITDGK